MRGIKRFRKNRFFPRAPKRPVTIGSFSKLFNEYYSIQLDGKDRATYYLIGRYEDKVSDRLLKERERLRRLGAEQAKEMWKTIINSENHLFKSIPKDNSWTGGYIPVPFKL